MTNMRWRWVGSLCLFATWAVAAVPPLPAPDDDPRPRNTQAETIPLTPADHAAKSFAAPEGFRVSLFASEPAVEQPIGIASDSRGRLWVAENRTYAEQAVGWDLAQDDRIVILEDGDGDGRAERRTVFQDGLKRLTSVETVPGGVYALCPPQLLYFADRDGDDRPDGPAEVVLDGFDAAAVRHNIANGLRWGPDGWLYGRHGILATSKVGTPETPPDKRVPINCGIWRYHPTRKTFEVVANGTTNSWGMDWDARGELFFINTVIGHLWHAVPGSHLQRMYGEDFRPHLYDLIPATSDHVHWDTAEVWSDIRKGVTATTDQKGGGHAHSGFLIYQGTNWPERYRNTALTINLHGRRLNNDTIERKGAGFVAHHGDDLLRTSDPWFRAVELIDGPDGGVYLADWTDIGECHENDGVHRTTGRIFKVTHGDGARPPVVDVAKLDEPALLSLVIEGDEWHARRARIALRHRGVEGRASADLAETLKARQAAEADPIRKLRLMWAIATIDKLDEPWLVGQLGQGDESVRSWAVRLLVDRGTPSADAVRALTRMAEGERSGLVLLYLASALQKLAPADRWPLARAIAARQEFAGDPALPLMVWYGIEPVAADQPAEALALAGSGRLPVVHRYLARRLTADLDASPDRVGELVRLAARPESADRRGDLLAGMAEALRGRRKAGMPPGWPEAVAVFLKGPDEATARLARELAVVFGDGRTIADLLRTAQAREEPVDARREALRVVVAARVDGLVPILTKLLGQTEVAADAARGLASFNDPGTPPALIDGFRLLPPAAKTEAIVALCSRPAYASALLDAIAGGKIDRSHVPAFQVRQMQNFADESVRRRVAELWPEVRQLSAEKRGRIGGLRERLDAKVLATADRSNGRKVFDQACASCHTLFGTGGKVGPDLTGSQRSDLNYLLENIVDPSATVAADFRMATVALADGRVLNGIVGGGTGRVVSIQTPTERIVVDRGEVEQIKPTELSLMPEGLLDPLPADQIRDLIAYLMAESQVPSPGGGR